jgi:hypothetical protein
MCLKEDIHQTRVEKEYFSSARFLCGSSLKYRYFFLFQRASKTAGAVRARFFIMLFDIRKKFIERSMSQKTA